MGPVDKDNSVHSTVGQNSGIYHSKVEVCVTIANINTAFIIFCIHVACLIRL